MNTLKIAALYTPYVVQLLSTPTPEAHQALLALLARHREDYSLRAGHEVRIRHSVLQGLELDQLCSPRVFAWACAQLPATDSQAEDESWSAATMDFTTKKPAFTICYGAGADFATLLRGMRHYRRKLDRQAGKLLTQLHSYHCAQLVALALQRELANAQPVSKPVALALPTNGVLPRFYAGLRRQVAAKIHQVAVAAEAIVLGETMQVA